MLEIIPSDEFGFSSTGLPVPGDQDDNLCIRAYRLLQEDFDLPPVKIHLHKIIPMGAGLGGGSSDAAWTLRGLNDIFELKLDTSGLHPYAAKLGSDCAFFLYDQPMLASGRGDVLTPCDVDLGNLKIVIVYPGVHVNTAQAYAGLTPQDGRPKLNELLKKEIGNWKEHIVNDFEKTVFIENPPIAKIKEELYMKGAIYASMSGSGSAVFGLFEEAPSDLKDIFKGYQIFISRNPAGL